MASEKKSGHNPMGFGSPVKTGWLDLHQNLWRIWDLTMLFVWWDYGTQYKQTILGPLRHIKQPMFKTILFTLILGRVAKQPTDSLPPVLFYRAGSTAGFLC